jgi:preprotein translocase subunit SecA
LPGVHGAARDYRRAEKILSEALSVPDLRDREYVLERLAEVYESAGWKEAEARVRRELEEVRSRRARRASEETGPLRRTVRRTLDFGEPGLPLNRLPEIQAAVLGKGSGRLSPKVGRNEPCPCGSGKKYKKCCLRTG